MKGAAALKAVLIALTPISIGSLSPLATTSSPKSFLVTLYPEI